jgi:RimJ/RimL family protein N-acetyltransferase
VDADALRAMLRVQLPELHARGLLAPYVIEDTGSGEILGGANLRLFDPMRDTVELGYWLFVDARGRGIATRVVRMLVEHAQANGIVRVEAHVRLGNTASEHVLERAGFEREGIKRSLLRHGGVRVDATLFAIVAPDAQ